MNTTARRLLLLTCACACMAALSSTGHSTQGQSGSSSIPDHPSKLKFPAHTFTVPARDGMRAVLDNGMVLWWALEGGTAGLPALFELNALVRASSLLDPENKPGLGDIARVLMRHGGTASHTREFLSRELDMRAARIETELDENRLKLSMSCLDPDRETCLGFFDEVLRRPVFNETDIERVREQTRESLKHRNDQPGDIEDREWGRLLLGKHPAAAAITRIALDAMTRDDLVAWHKACVQPQNIVLYGRGNMTLAQARARLSALFKDWKAGETQAVLDVPPAKQAAEPGICIMHHDQDQAHIRVGHVSYMREDKDYYAVLLMNTILGGGSFSSRITTSVRVKNGLSYVSYSAFEMPERYEGAFIAACQTRNETAALAIRLMLEEIRRIREEKVTDEDLANARNFYLEAFPQRFARKIDMVEQFASAEYLGRPADYHEKWRERIAAVTVDDVKRVANQYLSPDKLVVYILGDARKVRAGNPNDPSRATKLDDVKMPVRDLPLPEPENLTVK